MMQLTLASFLSPEERVCGYNHIQTDERRTVVFELLGQAWKLGKAKQVLPDHDLEF